MCSSSSNQTFLMPTVLPMSFSPGQVHYGFSVTKEINSKTFLGWKGLLPGLFSGSRSSTIVSASTQSTGLSSLYSAITAYCLWVWRRQPSNRPVTPSGGLSSVRILAIGTPTSPHPPYGYLAAYVCSTLLPDMSMFILYPSAKTPIGKVGCCSKSSDLGIKPVCESWYQSLLTVEFF